MFLRSITSQFFPKNFIQKRKKKGKTKEETMNSCSFTNTATLLHVHAPNISHYNNHNPKLSLPVIKASQETQNPTNRRKFVTTVLISTSLAQAAAAGIGNGTDGSSSVALAESWGTRSFLKERFFEPGLSPEDAVARIKQTAEGMHYLREMVDRMAWRYVIFYIRLKQSYLSEDLKNAFTTLPQDRRKEYVDLANDLVHNMNQLDNYVRTPKVYESYLYYEKTLKNLDDIVAMFV